MKRKQLKKIIRNLRINLRQDNKIYMINRILEKIISVNPEYPVILSKIFLFMLFMSVMVNIYSDSAKIAIIGDTEKDVINWSKLVKKKVEFSIPKNISKSEPYDFNISHIEIHNNRSIHCYNNSIDKQSNSALCINLNVTSSSHKIIKEPNSSFQNPLHIISKMQDDKGTILLEEKKTKIYVSLDNSSEKEPDIGNVSISTILPHKDAKFISILKGYVTGVETIEQQKIEIKTLEKQIINIGEIAEFIITSVGATEIEYKIKYLIESNDTPPITFKVYSKDGKEIYFPSTLKQGTITANQTASTTEKITIKREKSIPTNAYATVTYTTKSKKIKIPFEFKNIPLP